MGAKLDTLFGGVYKGKKVLVTGDSGFKGSWLSIWLKLLGAEVYGYSLPPKTENDNFVVCGLKDIIQHKDGDIRDQNELQEYVKSINPDIAFHLAAQPIVLESYQDPKTTFETNLMGTVNFLEAVKNVESIKSAVVITSDKVYENAEQVWGYRENDRLGGHDPYSASKACDEIITSSYIRSFFSNDDKCNIATARAGNVIGGSDWGEYRIIPDFFRAIENNENLSIRNPNFVRPWQHVLEPLSGYLLLGVKLFTKKQKYTGAWNFGPNDRVHLPVQELIEGLIEYTGQGSYKILNQKQNEKETSLLQLDISKAINLLGWSPVLTIDECIEFTADGYIAATEVNNVFNNRAEQITKYIELGTERNIDWIINQ